MADDADSIEILYRDDVLVAVCKPSGLAVHRGWARDPTYALTEIRDRLGQWVYPVHRLDRATSGVLVFALDRETARGLQAQFAGGRVAKRYLALVRGIPPETGVIDHPVKTTLRGKERVPAVTEFRRLGTFEGQEPVRAFGRDSCPVGMGRDIPLAPLRGDAEPKASGFRGGYALIEARPRTGRLHQIRRHFKHLSHPLIGDVRYGKGEHNRYFRERFGLYRLALHALEMRLEHPVDGRPLRWVAEVPRDLAGPLEAVGLWPL